MKVDRKRQHSKPGNTVRGKAQWQNTDVNARHMLKTNSMCTYQRMNCGVRETGSGEMSLLPDSLFVRNKRKKQNGNNNN